MNEKIVLIDPNGQRVDANVLCHVKSLSDKRPNILNANILMVGTDKLSNGNPVFHFFWEKDQLYQPIMDEAAWADVKNIFYCVIKDMADSSEFEFLKVNEVNISLAPARELALTNDQFTMFQANLKKIISLKESVAPASSVEEVFQNGQVASSTVPSGETVPTVNNEPSVNRVDVNASLASTASNVVNTENEPPVVSEVSNESSLPVSEEEVKQEPVAEIPVVEPAPVVSNETNVAVSENPDSNIVNQEAVVPTVPGDQSLHSEEVASNVIQFPSEPVAPNSTLNDSALTPNLEVQSVPTEVAEEKAVDSNVIQFPSEPVAPNSTLDDSALTPNQEVPSAPADSSIPSVENVEQVSNVSQESLNIPVGGEPSVDSNEVKGGVEIIPTNQKDSAVDKFVSGVVALNREYIEKRNQLNAEYVEKMKQLDLEHDEKMNHLAQEYKQPLEEEQQKIINMVEQGKDFLGNARAVETIAHMAYDNARKLENANASVEGFVPPVENQSKDDVLNLKKAA